MQVANCNSCATITHSINLKHFNVATTNLILTFEFPMINNKGQSILLTFLRPWKLKVCQV